MGRTGEAIKVRGLFLIPREVEMAVSKFTDIAKARAVITRAGYRDNIGVDIELNDESTDRESLTTAFQQGFQDSQQEVDVQATFVGFVHDEGVVA